MTLYSPLCSEKVNFVREDVGDTSNNNNLFQSNKKLILRRSQVTTTGSPGGFLPDIACLNCLQVVFSIIPE